MLNDAVTTLSVSYTYPEPLPVAPTLVQIRKLQDVMLSGAAGPIVDLSDGLAHYFAPGMYGRELAIPANRMVIGKTHRHAHLVQLLSGTTTIVTDQGRETVTGPKTWVSPAGVKRALVTHTDCVFFTFHLNPDDSTDTEQLVADLTIPEPHDVLPAEFADALQGIYA